MMSSHFHEFVRPAIGFFHWPKPRRIGCNCHRDAALREESPGLVTCQFRFQMTWCVSSFQGLRSAQLWLQFFCGGSHMQTPAEQDAAVKDQNLWVITESYLNHTCRLFHLFLHISWQTLTSHFTETLLHSWDDDVLRRMAKMRALCVLPLWLTALGAQARSQRADDEKHPSNYLSATCF